MRRIVISSIAALILAACGPLAPDDPASDHGTYEIDAATGETTVSLTTQTGTLRINSGVNVAADLPNGWSLYPGAEVQSTTNAAMADGKAVIATFISEDSPAAIIAFYREQAEANGVAIEVDATIGEGGILAGRKDGGSRFSVITSAAEDGKTLTNLSTGENFGG